MTVRRVLFASLLAVSWMALDIAAASADPPGPTDYRSEVTEIEPNIQGIDVEIVGGDSFVLLHVADGLAVDVVGYSGEPYLRFLADGTVEENRLSPSKYLNEDRYASAEIPTEASPSVEPDWVEVADGGSYAWHDHRTHWMNDQPPPGRGPGDQVAEGVVPLLVAGTEVDVTVVSFWQERPSPLPIALGFVIGAVLAYSSWRRRDVSLTLLASASAAAVTGGVAYLSVPAETAPPWSLWVFPATSLALMLIVLFVRSELVARSRSTIMLIAALELVGWGIAHWSWLWPAELPTALPFWLDRLVAGSVLIGAIGAAALVLVDAAAPNRTGPVDA